jgi:hypothetical protein
MVQFCGKIRSNDNPSKLHDVDDVLLIQIDQNENEKLSCSGKFFKSGNKNQGILNDLQMFEGKKDIQQDNSDLLNSRIQDLFDKEKLKSASKSVTDMKVNEREYKAIHSKKETKVKADQRPVVNSTSKKITNLSNNKAIFSKKFIEDSSNGEIPFIYNKRMILFKTEMCRSFTEAGVCKYGDSCQFCHDPKELRIVQRHPKYKNEGCKTFWTEGSCPYGNRCCFVHREDPEIKNIKKLQKFHNITQTADETAELDLVLDNNVDFNSIVQSDCDSVKFTKVNLNEYEKHSNTIDIKHLENEVLDKGGDIVDEVYRYFQV